MVPPGFDSVGEYLEEVLDFLKTYEWVYASPNTHILVNRVFDEFPGEWADFIKNLTNEELNDLASGKIATGAPQSLTNFFLKLKRFKFKMNSVWFDEAIKFPNNCNLSRKKQHELVALAPLIHETCSKNGCDYVIDVGSGLGYLPRLLYDKYKYKTLAIEGSIEKFSRAQTLQKKFPESEPFVTYLNHFITNESDQQIRDTLKLENFTNICITGLHACADLSVTVLELFLKLEFCKSLVIMPCCYHRLKVNETKDGFENFPVSELLKGLLEKTEMQSYLNVPFLRVACQGAADNFCRMTEEEHQEQINSWLQRAVLEEVSFLENRQIRRLKRKSGRLNKTSTNSESSEPNLRLTHSFEDGELTADFLEKVRQKGCQHKDKAHLFAALAALQASIQDVCENVVLLDRVTFLKEQGVECSVVRVTDEVISPRCHALVATKP